ncbi:MAG: hypothetical protein JWM74_534 [Myxococcaceae bacterium]|nr:hypothetical protein [Myxococcaceae bacterium]
MQWVARIEIALPSDVIERAPTFWEKIQALAGAAIDLGTERIRDRMEAATLVYEIRRALDALGIDNARSLTIDGAVVFHDEVGVAGDMPELVAAFLDHTSMFGTTFEELRLSAEHEEAGLHFEIEALVTSEHRRQDPSARITVLGRVLGADGAGEGVEKQVAAARVHFGAFASRVEGALRRNLPEGVFDAVCEEIAFLQVAKKLPEERVKPATRSAISIETASPQRNFTLTLEQRIAAAVIGVPAYAARARKIEDLEAALVEELAAMEGKYELTHGLERKIALLNALVQDHNRYYPVESNLRIDVTTGQLLDMRGEPWEPLPLATAESLRALARSR